MSSPPTSIVTDFITKLENIQLQLTNFSIPITSDITEVTEKWKEIMFLEMEISRSVSLFRSIPGIAQTAIPHSWPEFIHLFQTSSSTVYLDGSAKHIQAMSDNIIDIVKGVNEESYKKLLIDLTVFRNINLISRTIDSFTCVISTLIDICLTHRQQLEEWHRDTSRNRNRKTSYHG
jgi:hypothetical protein